MANSKRAPLRARSRAPEDMRAPKGATVRAMKARAPKKSAQTVVVEEQIAEGEDPATVRLDGRRLSRRIEFTPRLVEHIRLRYEEAGDSLDVISRSIDIAKATLLRLVREQQWTRAPRGPRDLSPAARLLMETRALEDDAAPRAQDVSSQTASPQDASPDDTAAILDRLLARGDARACRGRSHARRDEEHPAAPARRHRHRADPRQPHRDPEQTAAHALRPCGSTP